MEKSFNITFFGQVYASLLRKSIHDRHLVKDILAEYKHIMLRAKDIGNDNMLLSSYTLAAFFIAMNRCDLLGEEQNYNLLAKSMKKSKLLKLVMGNEKSYFSEKKMAKRREWSKKSKEHLYQNDWEVDVIEKDDKYQFGLDYRQCGVCKLCKDENCFEYAKWLCKLDYLLVDIMGIQLDRTSTLAEGGDKCDFRFKSKNNLSS